MRKWYPAFLIAVTLLASVIAYPRLDDRLPIHWDLQGRVNGYGSKLVALFLLPVILAGMWALMRALPKIDPRRENFAKMQGAYDMVVNGALTIMAVMHLVMIGAQFGMPIAIERLMPALVGAMFVLIGNVLPQARPNWFFGIRTPWTLSNDRVWERTHRVGGYLFVTAGMFGIVSAVLPVRIGVTAMIVTCVVAAVGSLAYSYVAWRQEMSKGALSK